MQIGLYKKKGIPEVEDSNFKARFVAQYFIQKEEIVYNEIFSPVMKHSPIHVLLEWVARFNLEFENIGVKTSFLHGDLEETICLDQPKGFLADGNKDHICQLMNFLYGLRNPIDSGTRSLMYP